MTAVTTTAAETEFKKIVSRVTRSKEPVALTSRGKVVAGIVSAEDFEYLRRIREKEDKDDLKAARKELAAYKRDGKTIPWEDIKREHGL
jgi:prevent-host-death family protein